MFDDVIARHNFEGTRSPTESENRWSDAEGDDIRKRVQLHAEVAGRVRQTGDAAVEAVQNISDSDGEGGAIEVALQNRDDRETTTKNIADREQARNNRQSAQLWRLLNFAFSGPLLFDHPTYFILPM